MTSTGPALAITVALAIFAAVGAMFALGRYRPDLADAIVARLLLWLGHLEARLEDRFGAPDVDEEVTGPADTPPAAAGPYDPWHPSSTACTIDDVIAWQLAHPGPTRSWYDPLTNAEVAQHAATGDRIIVPDEVIRWARAADLADLSTLIGRDR